MRHSQREMSARSLGEWSEALKGIFTWESSAFRWKKKPLGWMDLQDKSTFEKLPVPNSKALEHLRASAVG